MIATFLVPLRTEAVAVRSGLCRLRVRRSLPGVRVVRTGGGVRRSTAALAALGPLPVVVVLGLCGGLDPALCPGDLIVADALTRPDGSPLAVDLSAATPVAAALVAAGLRARVGTVAGADALVRGSVARQALYERGASGVDLESWALVGPSPGPALVVRSVVDTPSAELLSPATITGGIRALRSLRRAAPVIAEHTASVTFADRTGHGTNRL